MRLFRVFLEHPSYMWPPADPSTYFSFRIYIQGLSFILVFIYIDLYGYTDRLTCIRSAGWQLDMYMFIYINGYLPMCQHICHPEYTYRVYPIYRCVSSLICMDIQIGWQLYRSAGTHVHTLACIWCLRADLWTSSLPEFTLRPIYM